MRFYLSIFFCLIVLSAYSQQRGLNSERRPFDSALDTGQVNMDARFACIIGNSAYDPRLKNPGNDADSLAAVLRNYGFEITLLKDNNFQQLMTSISAFSEMVKSKRGIALFYFSGHGLQWDSRNFLLPVNPQLNYPTLEKSLLEVNTILSAITYSRNGFNIVILDACRDNPLVKESHLKKGLTHQLEKAKNTYVFFATSSGDVADDGKGNNSPFTGALIRAIRNYDTVELTKVAQQVTLEVDSVTNGKQVPQAVSTLTKDFRFKKKIGEKKPKLFIYSVGISRYRSAGNMMFSAKGAIEFTEALKHHSRDFYESVEDFTLTDEHATAANVWKSLYSIQRKAMADDVIMIYFNGRILSDNDDYYLLPFDGDLEKSEFSAVSLTRFTSVLNRLPCKALFFLDGFEDSYSRGGDVIAFLNSPKNNLCVLKATSYGQYALEDRRYQGGLFTHALLEALKNAESKENRGFVDVESVAEYIQETVLKLSDGRQKPNAYYPTNWNNFILAKASGSKKLEPEIKR